MITNRERAERFADILPTYPDDERTNLIDILADAMHWCRFHEENFCRALEMARTHFSTELDAEGVDEPSWQACEFTSIEQEITAQVERTVRPFGKALACSDEQTLIASEPEMQNLAAVLDYLWGDELEDFRAEPRCGHIFRHLVALENWLFGERRSPDYYLDQAEEDSNDNQRSEHVNG